MVVGTSLFAVRIIVAAQGQVLKAVIDTAVNSSPFLDDGERAAIMSLPNTPRTFGSAEDSAGARELAGAEREEASGHEVPAPFCYHCGVDLADESGLCPACGKQL